MNWDEDLQMIYFTYNLIYKGWSTVPVMTGQRRVDPSAVRYLIDRIKQAKVSGQKQEYQRQGRDVNNTRQKSGSQAQVQSSKVGQSGVKHRDNKR